MSVTTLLATASGVCDATGACTLTPGGGFSPGMFNVWDASASLQRPGASVVAMVDGNQVASAYGLTAVLGPVTSAGNNQVTFHIQGNTPGAPVTVTINGWQATDPSELPQMPAAGNATLVNIQPMDGAELVNYPGPLTTNFLSGLLDVSQWQAVNLAISPPGPAFAVMGATLGWFAEDGVTQVGGWATALALPTAGGYAGAQFPYAQLLLPNVGPLVQLGLNPITGGGSNALCAVQLFQTNRLRPVSPYSVQGPYLAQYINFTLAAGNSQLIPLTALYSGPAAFHLTNPGGATVQLQADDGTGNYRAVWNDNTEAGSYQAALNIPPTRAQFQVTNTSGGSLTYSFTCWATPTGSVAAGSTSH